MIILSETPRKTTVSCCYVLEALDKFKTYKAMKKGIELHSK